MCVCGQSAATPSLTRASTLAPTLLLTHPGGACCLLKVTVPVLAKGLEDHGADSHERLHHAELQSGLWGEKAKGQDEHSNPVPSTSSGRVGLGRTPGWRGAPAPAPAGTAVWTRRNTSEDSATWLREKTRVWRKEGHLTEGRGSRGQEMPLEKGQKARAVPGTRGEGAARTEAQRQGGRGRGDWLHGESGRVRTSSRPPRPTPSLAPHSALWAWV